MAEEFTQEQIDAMIAQMKSKEKKTSPAAAVMGGARKGGSGKVNALEVLNAPKTSSYADSLVDDNGKFDGDYEITIQRCEVRNAEKGQIFAVSFKIDSSSNDKVREGSVREHAIFWWSKAGKGETRVLWEKFAESQDKELDEDFAEDIYGEAQAMAGTRWSLTVSTKPQKQNREKSFSHHRYSSMD